MEADSDASTLLSGTVQAAPAGVKGFDANTPISAAAAQAFYQKGYRFCIRYVGRVQMASYDLTQAEAKTILQNGLALMVVQHVLNPGWSPTAELGAQYGSNAARFSKQIGVPPGVNVWCDLESVSEQAAAGDVIAYCNAWHDQVAESGYVPGLYVGYGAGLTPQQLYQKLKFRAYWGAYNLNSDEVPAVRGLQMKQKVGTGGTIAGITTEAYDDDYTLTDALGGNVLWLAPQ